MLLWKTCGYVVFVLQVCTSIITATLPSVGARLATGFVVSIIFAFIIAKIAKTFFSEPLLAVAVFASSNLDNAEAIIGEPPTTSFKEITILVETFIKFIQKPTTDFDVIVPRARDNESNSEAVTDLSEKENPLVNSQRETTSSGQTSEKESNAEATNVDASKIQKESGIIFQNIMKNKKRGGWGMLKKRFVNNWQTEMMIFVAFRISYKSVTSESCCADITKIHTSIFEKIKGVSLKHGTKWEWSGNAECVLYWQRNLNISVNDILDVTLQLRDLELRNVSAFKWSVAVTEGESRCGKIRIQNSPSDVVFSDARDRALAMAQFGLSVQSSILCEDTVDLGTMEGIKSQFIKMPCWSVLSRVTPAKKPPPVYERERSFFRQSVCSTYSTNFDASSIATSRTRRTETDSPEGEWIINYSQLRTSRISGYSVIWKAIEEQDWQQAAGDLASLVKRNQEDKHLRNVYNHISGVWKQTRMFPLAFDKQLINIRKPTDTEMGIEATLDFQPAILGVSEDQKNASILESSIARQPLLTDYQVTAELSVFTELFTYHIQSNHVGSMTVGRTAYEHCFSAENAVDWMCERFEISVSHAVQLGELLRMRGTISHPKGDNHTFKYGKIVFKFRDESLCACPEDVSWDKVRIYTLLASALHIEERQQEFADISGVAFRNNKKFLSVEQQQEEVVTDRLNKVYNLWSVLRLLITISNAICIALFIGYDIEYTTLFMILQWFCDCTLIPGVLMEYQLFCAKIKKRKLHFRAKLLESYKLGIIISSCFPLEFVACLVMFSDEPLWYPGLRVNRLACLLGFGELAHSIQEAFLPGTSPIFMQIGKFLVLQILGLMIVSSILHFVIFKYEGVDEATEFLRWPELRYAGLSLRLTACFDWSARAVVGYACRWPQTDTQVSIVLVVQLLGLAAWTTVIAYSHALLDALNPSKRAYEELVDNVKEYCTGNRVPINFTEEVLSYIRVLWNTSRMYTTTQYEFLFDAESHSVGSSWMLPAELRYEFLFYLNLHVVNQLPWLQSHASSAEFTFDFVTHLRQEIFTMGTTVVQHGAQGTSFFIIMRGSVKISYPDKEEIIGEGDFFGELPLIFDMPSPVVVTCLDVVSVYAIAGRAFNTAIEIHSKKLAHVLSTADRRLSFCMNARLSLASCTSRAGRPYSPIQMSPRADQRRRQSISKFQDYINSNPPAEDKKRKKSLGFSNILSLSSPKNRKDLEIKKAAAAGYRQNSKNKIERERKTSVRIDE